MNRFIQFFEQFARKTSLIAGKPITFVLAFLVIIIWAVTGPMFGFSDTWQLVINTGTTIITFLMVFLVQSAQNRDAKALQLKLDELIFKMGRADNVMMEIEELSERELMKISERYRRLRERAAKENKAKRKKKAAEAAEKAGDGKAKKVKMSSNGKPRDPKTLADL